MTFDEYSTLLKHYALTLELVSNVAEFIGEDEAIALSNVSRSTNTLKEVWGKHEGTAEDFYRENEEYLYDLAGFNGTAVYFKYRLFPLTSIHGAKILDLGCGIGTVSFLIADGGNEVTGYDVNRRLIDFCEFKKRKYNLKGLFTPVMPNLDDFDFIIAVDVLEHIEDLGDFLTALGDKTKEGTMFCHLDCFGSRETSPMHFDHSARIGAFLKDAGFEVLNPSMAQKTSNKISVL